MRKALFPGSFDPVTNGHMDIIRRGLKLFDGLVIAVARNERKCGLFTIEERKKLLIDACQGLPNIRIESFDGLLVDAVKTFKVNAVIRGLRAISDFEYEFQMALMNRELDETFETVFLMSTPAYSFVSSRMIKEIVRLGGDVSTFVPSLVASALTEKKINKEINNA